MLVRPLGHPSPHVRVCQDTRGERRQGVGGEVGGERGVRARDSEDVGPEEELEADAAENAEDGERGDVEGLG